MKSNSISNLIHVFGIPHSAFRTLHFHQVAWLTLIVYFIISFCGYFNFLVAWLTSKGYFPLRSYLIAFDKSELTYFHSSHKAIYNLAGFKTIINTSIPYKIIDDIFFIFITSSLVILFLIGYKMVQTNKVSQTKIIKWSIIFSLLMTFAIPSHSSDLYGYIARGAQQSLYNHNPYLQTVSEIRGYSTNPLFLNFMWPLQPTTYGPVFIHLAKVIVFLSNNNFFLSFLNFKLFNLTLFFFLILFVIRTSKVSDIYLIAWNPLILIQGLWNCHNDLFSGVMIFLGIYLLRKESFFWGSFCLTFASGIKFVSLLVIPLIFFYFLKTKIERNIFLHLILGLCSGLILITIFSIDYLIPTHGVALTNLNDSFNKLFENVGLIHKSLLATLYTLIKYFCSWQSINCDLQAVKNLLKYCFYFTFGIFYFSLLVKKKANLIFDMILAIFIFLVFIIGKFHSWYLLNLIVLTPMLEAGLLKNILIALSLSHSYAITFLDQAKILNFVSMTLLPTLLILLKKGIKR